MTEKDLNELLWSVDRTVRRVLDSQEIRSLGADIVDSLNRAGEDLKGSFSGQNTPDRGRQGGWQASDYRGKYNQYNKPQPSGWNTPGYNTNRKNWQSGGQIVPQEPNWRWGVPLLLTVCGLTGTAFGALLTLRTLAFTLFGFYPYDWGMTWTVLYGAGTLAAVGITAAGGIRLNVKNRMRKIWRYLKQRDFCKISEAAQQLHLSDKKVVKTVEKMLAQNLLEGHFDEEKTCLMLTDEAYQRYLESRQARREQQAAAEDPRQSALAETIREGSSYIRRIREINNDLPEPVISAKLDDLEKVCQQIFSYVGEHPDKVSSIRKLMSYYLPTTLKLLEAYRKLERQNTGAESEQKTKQEILHALDDINLAFQNLLDDLMQNEYLDLSADISVLQSMLAQEGLKEDFTPDQKNDARMERMGSDLQEDLDRIELKLHEPEKEYEPELHI